MMNAEKKSIDKVVAVAMSGGVDSAVVAALVVKQGYKVFGITAKMTKEYSKCCADEDICRAAKMCAQLGIEHHVVDVCDEFQSEVIDPFMESYISGKTPSPCVNCNSGIKFGSLMRYARELGADLMATGHYVGLREDEGAITLVRGVDATKDQSYFLARLTPQQLRRSLFPLGELHKREVSQMAADFELEARKSRESQDLCFVTEGSHGEWVDIRSFDTTGVGEIVDMDGRVVGQHSGIHHYTIGQRKGLGIAMGYPVYVVRIDAEQNRIVVGPREFALGDRVNIKDAVWRASSVKVGDRFLCQVRYNHKEAPCVIESMEDDNVTAVFDEPQFAITPGQLAVFYENNGVAGSGWIV